MSYRPAFFQTFYKARKMYSSQQLFEKFEHFLAVCGPFDMVFDIQNFGHNFTVLKTLIKDFKPKSVLFVGEFLRVPCTSRSMMQKCM